MGRKWIVLLADGFDMPEVFGPFGSHPDAFAFAEAHRGEVSVLFPPTEVDAVLAERGDA